MFDTKFGCAAPCGACIVHLNSQAIRSCVTLVSAAEGQKFDTIEHVTGGTQAGGNAVRTPWSRWSCSADDS
jgi:isoquinoline 1-oxidoreductase alpha subunit